MDSNEQVAKLVVDFAAAAFQSLNANAASWTAAYLRYHSEDTHSGASGSCIVGGAVRVVDDHAVLSLVNKYGSPLRRLLAPTGGVFVCLLALNSEMDYKVRFDFDDIDKWLVDKMNGRTGIPSME